MGSTVLGICILTYNSRAVVADCINSLQRALERTPNRMVVVDNHSKDGTAAFVRHTFPDVPVIELPSNVGYAIGNNLGASYLLKEFGTDFLAFVNPDVIVQPDTLSSLQNALLTAPGGACAGGSPMVNGKPWRESFRNKPKFFQKLLIPGVLRYIAPFSSLIAPLLARLEQAYFIPPEQIRSGTPVFCFSGACFLVSASAFVAIGGFDSHTFLFQEEYILAERLRRAGYEVIAVPEALYRHAGQHSVSKRPVTSFLHFVRSEQHLISTYWKWGIATRLGLYVYRLVEVALYACSIKVHRIAGRSAAEP